jgi:hypothetical protein
LAIGLISQDDDSMLSGIRIFEDRGTAQA